MTIRRLWAALAFSMAVSLATHAHAAPFSVTVDGATGADGSVSFTLTGDTANSVGTLQFGEDEEAPNFIDFLSTSFTDPNATFAITHQMRSQDPFGLLTLSADFMVSNPAFAFAVTSTDGSSQVVTGYELAFSINVELDPRTGIIYGNDASAASLLIPPSSVLPIGEIRFSGNSFTSVVPLPSSLPLLAGGVVLLGALGWAGRRRTMITQGGEG